MSRPCEQNVSCLEQDLIWARRMRKRARDNETRPPAKNTRYLQNLKEIMSQLQEDIDEMDQPKAKTKSVKPGARKKVA